MKLFKEKTFKEKTFKEKTFKGKVTILIELISSTNNIIKYSYTLTCGTEEEALETKKYIEDFVKINDGSKGLLMVNTTSASLYLNLNIPDYILMNSVVNIRREQQ